ncbi:MAG: response regulator [Planctomycetes bacterium]|nr:response regulator [Planctomycetota bacterium]
MEIYVVERNKLVRDRIVVGLQQFPEFIVTCGTGYAAIEEIRQRDYEVVFLGVPDLGNSEGMQLLEKLRDLGRPIDIVVTTQEAQLRDLAKQKAKYNISAVMAAPIDPADFFRVVSRLRERREDSSRSMPSPLPR